MKEITVLLLDQMFSSTAIGPMEVFRHAGSLWNILTGSQSAPSFHVTTASADGEPVCCDGGIQIRPNVALKDVGKVDLIFVPTTGLSVDDVLERNAPIVPWLQRRATRGVAIASVCSGVGLVAAAGLAGWQARHHALGVGGVVPRKISPREMDAGVDGDRRPRLLLWRRSECFARSQPLPGGKILWTRNRDADRQSPAHRNAAGVAVRIRRLCR